MRPLCLAVLLSTMVSAIVIAQSNSVSPSPMSTSPISKSASVSQSDPARQAQVFETYGKLPLSFEANHGQADGKVRFLSRTSEYTLFLTRDEAVLALRPEKARKPVAKGVSLGTVKAGVLRMKLRKANPAAKVSGVDELAGTSNYFIGNDPAKWRTNVPTFAKVKYEGIYSGIDLVYYGNQQQLEYDFIVAPGADPHRIEFDIRGAKRIRRDAQGELVFKVGEDEIRWHHPVVYQEKNGAQQRIAARYALTANRVKFELAKYDASRPLYIDPLIYSTYLGGSGDDDGNAIAVDASGSAYITGQTASIDFPTANSFQPSNAGSYDAFVVKLNPAGSALVYSTYLGGSSVDYGYGIAVDSSGNAYVVGNTASIDFPTMNPLQPANAGGLDVFITALNASGSALIYSTYLGGSGDDLGSAIALDSSANAYITGSTASTNFPTINPLQTANDGDNDAFVAEITPDGSTLVYSTYLGGSNQDYGNGIAVDSSGNAYIAGQTLSPDFPTMNPLQPTDRGTSSAFVSKISPGGTALVYSTYLGGTGYDLAYAVAVDSAGDTYVTGSVSSTNFPTMNPLQRAYGGGAFDAFVSEINPTGSALVYSTYLGGKEEDDGYAIAVDSMGNAYVAGYTLATNFPAQNAFQKKYAGGGDVFVSKLTSTGSALSYSTYLGGSYEDSGAGIAVDSADYAYVTGDTASTNFPTQDPVQPTNGGGANDAFVAKIDVRALSTTTLSSSPNSSNYGQSVTLTAQITSIAGAPADGETVAFMKGKTVLGTGTLSGGSASFTATLPVGSNSITAVYSGDSNLDGSTSKAVDQVVHKATTATALTSSQNPSNPGESVTFTATVAPQFIGTVTGTVTFYNGTAPLKTVSLSGGSAECTTSKLPAGSLNITATYNGSPSFDDSSGSLTQIVN